MYALCDANNAYVEMERLFRPSLRGIPVTVLSSNDASAISRSNEAKELGIRMGQPWFEFKHLEQSHGLVSLSSNFELYGELSNRLMDVLASFSDRSEIYSIDEIFVSLHGQRGDLLELGHRMRERALQWVGLPCGIGIGPTKTLAKLANMIAKTAERKPGSYPAALARVCHLGIQSAAERQALFAATPIGEVWGIGRRISAQLEAGGVRTVAELMRLEPATVRRHFGLATERTLRELHGISCIPLQEAPAPKQSIVVSRSFGQPITRGRDLAGAVSEFASRAAEKLRAQGSAAGVVQVFARTSLFRPQDPPYSASMAVPLRRPTADTTALVRASIDALRAIYRSGYRYAKAGVLLADIQPQGLPQGELDFEQENAGGTGAAPSAGAHQARERAMAAVDAVNRRYGRGTVTVASAGLERDRQQWAVRQERRTPRWTTRWDELPIVRA